MLRITRCFITCGVLTNGFRSAFRSPYWRQHHLSRWTRLSTELNRFLRIEIIAAISWYIVWYWFSGFQLDSSTNSCKTYGFFFARCDVYGGLQIFYKITSIVQVLLYGFLMIPYILLLPLLPFLAVFILVSFPAFLYVSTWTFKYIQDSFLEVLNSVTTFCLDTAFLRPDVGFDINRAS